MYQSVMQGKFVDNKFSGFTLPNADGKLILLNLLAFYLLSLHQKLIQHFLLQLLH